MEQKFLSLLKKQMRFRLLISIILLSFSLSAQNYTYKIALLKYNGGGDWYVNPTSLKNLSIFCDQNLHTSIDPDYATVEVGSPDIFNYPLIHITGHGNIIFSPQEAQNLRNYLISGGFLEVSDSYGLDKYIRREMKKVFPETDFIEIPFSHPIYHQKFTFNNGLPKIHKHDGKPAQGFGIFYQGRLIVFYDYECDLGDGWADTEVYHDPIEKHIAAMKMGANIIQYVFTH